MQHVPKQRLGKYVPAETRHILQYSYKGEGGCFLLGLPRDYIARTPGRLRQFSWEPMNGSLGGWCEMAASLGPFVELSVNKSFLRVQLWKEDSVGIELAMGWTTDGLEFESQKGQEFPLLHVVQTGSGVHPTSYPMDTGGALTWNM
jgi:hypothetical protein